MLNHSTLIFLVFRSGSVWALALQPSEQRWSAIPFTLGFSSLAQDAYSGS
ncbi:MAG: hypothetical protein U5J96_15835 [Ignavibacteriaceae bacterium]|nr:hypothetical protein [Ignavibacteriaceae bacterium]